VSARRADQPPADILRDVSAYVAALEGLLRHAAAVRDERQALLDRYAAAPRRPSPNSPETEIREPCSSSPAAR
jgi:hypothetical protein